MARRTSIGLDVGTGAVRAAELSFTSSGVVLERSAEVPLPEGAVRDGEVLDAAAVSAALVELWRRGRFSHRRVRVGVANQRVVVREVEVPQMPPADLRKALPFQVQDVLPMPVEAAVLDFHPLEVRTGAAAPVVRGLLVAAWRETVTALLAAVQGARLVPDAVDLTAFAVLRAVGSGLGSDAAAEALVDVGSDTTQVVVHSGGAPHFVRILASGGDDVTAALAEGTGLTTAQAEQLKRDLDEAPVLDEADPRSASAHALQVAVVAFLEEVRSTIDYAAATSGHRAERVVLTGGGARQAGLDAQLAAMTGVPVHVGSVERRVRRGRHLRGVTAEGPTTAVGLALGASA
ncbi:type IV pilus assembly protein PilM [Quadrisphaera sp. KR29]|uniref:type IV pilus assembly protein PilM n=1 Tax=Quadrisphaera sp. KR29 TaxID=3461391 RepID=UPI004044F83E